MFLERQECKLVFTCPASVRRVDDASKGLAIHPCRALGYTAPAIVGSLPWLVCFRDADHCVEYGFFRVRHFDEEEVLLCVRVVAGGPSRPAAVQVVTVGREYGCVDGPVVGHALQGAEELPTTGIHRVRLARLEEGGTMPWVADPWRGAAGVDVPHTIEVVCGVRQQVL